MPTLPLDKVECHTLATREMHQTLKELEEELNIRLQNDEKLWERPSKLEEPTYTTIFPINTYKECMWINLKNISSIFERKMASLDSEGARVIDKFNGEKLNLWKSKLEMELASVDLWGIVDEYEEATPPNVNSKVKKKNTKKNQEGNVHHCT
jgi:hypothetical protein